MQQVEVGEISYFFENHINWNVPRMSDLFQADDCQRRSPKFGYNGEIVKFDHMPPGWSLRTIETSMVKLCITIENFKINPVKCIRVSMRNERWEEIVVVHCVWNCSYGVFNGVSKVDQNAFWRRRRNSCIPDGYLRLFCEMPLMHFNGMIDGTTNNKDNSNSKSISVDTPIGTWICEVCLVRSYPSDLRYRTSETGKLSRKNNRGLVGLSKNLKDLFKQNKDTDLTIKVQGRKFSVHRNILKVRLKMFDEMLFSYFATNNQNFIEIEDCEAEVFEALLVFVYSGKAENITNDNVFGLYRAADKYGLPDLKPECASFLLENMSLENICDVFSLALKYKETELWNSATEYFAKHMEKIIISCKWLLFVNDNPVEANDLRAKALKLGFKKKRLN